MGTIDFATVQWARKMAASLESLATLSTRDLKKLAGLLSKLAHLQEAGVSPTPAQMTVILQNLHTKNLEELEPAKGGLLLRFSGGGFAYEQFLLKADGRVPNHKYESKKTE